MQRHILFKFNIDFYPKDEVKNRLPKRECVIWTGNTWHKQKKLICEAIEIKLVNGRVIFLDTSYYFGINIGGKEQEQIWKINFKENADISETFIKISDK